MTNSKGWRTLKATRDLEKLSKRCSEKDQTKIINSLKFRYPVKLKLIDKSSRYWSKLRRLIRFLQ